MKWQNNTSGEKLKKGSFPWLERKTTLKKDSGGFSDNLLVYKEKKIQLRAMESVYRKDRGGIYSSIITPVSWRDDSCWVNGDALPLHVLRSGCRVKPTGQLQRTPVTESWHVLSQPPLFTAQVSAEKQMLSQTQPTERTQRSPSWPIYLSPSNTVHAYWCYKERKKKKGVRRGKRKVSIHYFSSDSSKK